MYELDTETVNKMKKIYTEKKEVLEYVRKFGNSFEKAAASVIIEVATASI
ncbi:hypothetical protein [Methanosarcina sp. 1.H.A.2.2]|nr:hypothetical protein [Methanosarcina sp. 1.H.A.2.2]